MPLADQEIRARMRGHAPDCPYCNGYAHLVTGATVYPHRWDLRALLFWQCKPCKAFVGCHKRGAPVDVVISDGTIPLGRLANAELRRAKSEAHAAFDPMWKEKGSKLSRREAYRHLANALGITPEECHIGMFDEEMCKRVVEIVGMWKAKNIC